jgi:ankyrin repeat protein
MPSNDKKKGKRSGARAATDDFDDMLAEFAVADLENAAKIQNTITITTTTASTSSTAPNPTDQDIVDACSESDIDRLRRWGRRGIRVGSANPLVAAAYWNKIDVMRCLVHELGADANQMIEDGLTPLIAAIQEGNLDAMRCLVTELGADVNLAVPDSNGDRLTPLFTATSSKQLESVRCLVKDLGVDVNQIQCDGRTVLTFAASTGNLDLVRLLVKELGADVNLATQNGHTPLMIAAYLKHEKIAKLLLKAGADAQASMVFLGISYSAAYNAAITGAPATMTEYLESKTHCSNSVCDGAGIRKCTGCKQVRYCGQACQLAHWPNTKISARRIKPIRVQNVEGAHSIRTVYGYGRGF